MCRGLGIKGFRLRVGGLTELIGFVDRVQGLGFIGLGA